jgi:hypothetical protein
MVHRYTRLQNCQFHCIDVCLSNVFAKGPVSAHHTRREFSKALFGTWGKSRKSAQIVCCEVNYTLFQVMAVHGNMHTCRAVF